MLAASVRSEDAVCVESMLTTWMDGETRARLMVDAGLTVYWLNSAAQTFLQEEPAVGYRQGRLNPRDRRTEQALRAFLADATGRLSCNSILDEVSGEHLILTAVRLPGPRADVIGLTLHRAGAAFDFDLADLRHAFGLTRSERQVAAHLLDGETADEVARALNVSLETVRVHIKRAYSKLGVCSREAFFRKLAPFVVLG